MASLGLAQPLAPSLERPTGRIAFGALLVFVFLVYANPGNLFPELGDLAFAKIAAAAALIALGGAWLLRDRPLHLGGTVGGVMIAFFAWMGASTVWSLWPSMTLDAFLDGLKYLAIFLLVANVVDSRARATVLMHALALASLIPAVGAIWSWAHGEHLVEGDRAGWIGLFANPNDLAHYLVVGIALTLGAREVARPRWLRLGYLLGIGGLATALLLTQSRGGMLAAGTVVALWALRSLASGRVAVGVAACVLLAVQLAPEATWRRAETAFDYRDDASAQGRLDAWRTGMNVVAARPFTGVGAGAFPLAWPEYAPGDAGPARTAHNTFIQLVAETGVPSLALFICALGIAAWRLRRLSVSDGDLGALARAAHVGMAGFVVCSLTGGLAYSWPLYLLLGLAVALPRIADASASAKESPCAASTA